MIVGVGSLIFISFSDSNFLDAKSKKIPILGISWWIGLSTVLSFTSMFSEAAAAWGALLSIATLLIRPVEVGFAAVVPFGCARAYFLYNGEITIYTARNDLFAYILLTVLLETTETIVLIRASAAAAAAAAAIYLYSMSMQSETNGEGKAKTYIDKVIEELVPYPSNARSSFEKQEQRLVRSSSMSALLPPRMPVPPLKDLKESQSSFQPDIESIGSPRVEIRLN
jgi:hypothetical protein